MKVGLVLHGDFPQFHGIESHAEQKSWLDTLANEIQKQGVDVEVHYLSRYTSRPTEMAHRMGHDVFLYPYIQLPKGSVVSMSMIRNVAKRRFDVLHLNSYDDFFTALFVAQAKKNAIPVIAHNHGCWLPYFLSTKYPQDMLYRNIWLRRTLKSFDRIIVQSSGEFNNLVGFGVPESVIDIIPMGVGNGFFREPMPPRDNHSFLYVGRFTEGKDLRTVVSAFKNVDAELHCVGMGDKTLFQSLVESGQVSLHEFTPKKELLIGHYQQAYMTIVPGIYGDGTGLVSLESMACGTPLIGVNIGGVPDLITGTENGLLYKSQNPEHLRSQLLFALRNPELILSWRKKAPNYVEPYKWKYIAPRILRVYEKVST